MDAPNHRPGLLKQQNKTHKTGRHRSKRRLDSFNKGKVSSKVLTLASKKIKKELNRKEKHERANQIRKNKRAEVLFAKRQHGTTTTPPFLVAVAALTEGVCSDSVIERLVASDSSNIVKRSEHHSDAQADYFGLNVASVKFKQRFTYLRVADSDLQSLLEVAKVADLILLLTAAEEQYSDFTEHCFSCLYAQGAPTLVHGIVGLDKFPLKKRNDVKKSVHKALEKKFGLKSDSKLFSIDSLAEAAVVVRHLGTVKLVDLAFRSTRPYLLGQKIELLPDAKMESDPIKYGKLKVTGYLMSQPLSANSLVHVPGYGDFQLDQIDSADDPIPLKIPNKEKNKQNGTDIIDESMQPVDGEDSSEQWNATSVVIDRPTEIQELTISEVTPDPLATEQPWPSDQEISEAVMERQRNRFRVPKGTSNYQAAWIINEDTLCDDEEEMGSEDSDVEIQDVEAEEGDSGGHVSVDEESVTTAEESSWDPMETHYDPVVEKQIMDQLMAEREDFQFPDEVDTPEDQPARMRFQKYRGLQNFRTSPWDPKEDLPPDYAKIFQFENFLRTKKKVMDDVLLQSEDYPAKPGQYVTLHIRRFPVTSESQELVSKSGNSPLVIFGMLPHEQKMSVVHFVLQRHSTNDSIIKSKDPLIFCYGYRRFVARPIFSTHGSGKKHKFERFFHAGKSSSNPAVMVASIYAPIMYPPATALVFKQATATTTGKEMDPSTVDLVATGSLYKVDPDRIIVKRTMLSGYPYKINKRSCVVRFMFHNREDILWFKPIELRTKYGRKGHITEALGTHGYMKCKFDGGVKSQDTVLLPLYKRVFPKWDLSNAETNSNSLVSRNMVELAIRIPESRLNYKEVYSSCAGSRRTFDSMSLMEDETV